MDPPGREILVHSMVKGINMKIGCVIIFSIFLLMSSCSQKQEFDAKKYERLYITALANHSTAPNYIVVEIQWNITKYLTCVEVCELAFSIIEDRGLSIKDIENIWNEISNNKQKIFIFSNKEVFTQLIPEYSISMVNDYSNQLSKLNLDEIRKAFSFENKENMHYLYNKYEGKEYYAHMKAIAHALFLNGILTGRGCIAPYLYIE